MAWSPDGTKLTAASRDNGAFIWDPITGEQLRQLTGPSGWRLSVAWSPDGTKLATGGDDSEIIWDPARPANSSAS